MRLGHLALQRGPAEQPCRLHGCHPILSATSVRAGHVLLTSGTTCRLTSEGCTLHCCGSGPPASGRTLLGFLPSHFRSPARPSARPGTTASTGGCVHLKGTHCPRLPTCQAGCHWATAFSGSSWPLRVPTAFLLIASLIRSRAEQHTGLPQDWYLGRTTCRERFSRW